MKKTNDPIGENDRANSYRRGKRVLDAGAKSREEIGTAAEASNMSVAEVRADIKFAEAVDTVVTNCGQEVLPQLLSPEVRLTKKDIGIISRMAPPRQRYEIQQVLQGCRPFQKPRHGLPPLDTEKYSEVPNRLARAGGNLRKCLDTVEKMRRSMAMPLTGRAPYLDEGVIGTIEAACTLLWMIDRVAEGDNMTLLKRDVVPSWPPVPPDSEATIEVMLRRACRGLPNTRGLLEKNIRDIPRLPQTVTPTPSEAAEIRKELKAIIKAAEALRLAIRTWDDDRKEIMTHRNVDLDAVVAAWLVDKLLFRGDGTLVIFVGRSRIADRCADCVVDVGGKYRPEELRFDHRPPDFASRNETCAALLVWEHLRDTGHDVQHLEDLVRVTYEGDSGRRSAAVRESRKTGPHAKLAKLKERYASDVIVYQKMSTWLRKHYLTQGPAK